MPGFTHLQSAQPVTFGHHCLAMSRCWRATGAGSAMRGPAQRVPLGAAALAGTSFPIDRHATAAALGFDRPTANSLDSVADRTSPSKSLSAASICAVHLSRFAEELVVWTSAQFGFVKLSDGYTTAPRSCRRSAIRRGRTGAGQGRADRRRAHRPAHRHEGPAARLFEGHCRRTRKAPSMPFRPCPSASRP